MNALQKTFAQGRIIRGSWSRRDGHGRLLLCLYTALAGDPAARPFTCPASLAPKWLAHLLPWLDDTGSEAKWKEHVRRIVALSPRFANVPKELSLRIQTLVRIAALETSKLSRHTVAHAPASMNCIDQALLCLRQRLIDEPPPEAWNMIDMLIRKGPTGCHREGWARACEDAPSLHDETVTHRICGAVCDGTTLETDDQLVDSILDILERELNDAN